MNIIFSLLYVSYCNTEAEEIGCLPMIEDKWKLHHLSLLVELICPISFNVTNTSQLLVYSNTKPITVQSLKQIYMVEETSKENVSADLLDLIVALSARATTVSQPVAT